MKVKFKILILLFFSVINLYAEDYEYQYFDKKGKDPHTPFSDYIPRSRLHFDTIPHYLEDFYLLYGLKQHYNEDTLRKNIDRLKSALNSKFRHPSMALVKVESEQEYLRYRNLMFMHINLLIMRSQLSIASRYDMQKIRFYNGDFAKDIGESLNIADKYYAEALPYWESAMEYAKRASGIKINTDLGFIENERYLIMKGELDFGKIIANYRKNIILKKAKLGATTASGKQ